MHGIEMLCILCKILMVLLIGWKLDELMIARNLIVIIFIMNEIKQKFKLGLANL